MVNEWRKLSLEECMSAIIDYRGKTPHKTKSGIPLITAKIVKDGRIERPKEFIDPKDYKKWMRRGIPKAGDVILTTEAPLGEVAQLDDKKVALAQRIIALRGKEDILDNTFLKYVLQSREIQAQLYSRSTGTTVRGIRQSELRKVLLPVPPIHVQRAIAHILGTLDDKIELNRRMNETLEQMARALFKAWFVDFEPVRAKMEGRWKRGQSLPVMPAHLYDLFPDRLVDSEIGKIPEGWKVVRLPEIVEVNPSRKLRKGENAPYLNMANMPTYGHVPNNVIKRIYSSGTRFKNGDTLVARITPCLENGKTAFVDFLDDGQVGWGSTEFIVLRPKPPLPPEFGYCLARSTEFREFAIQSMTGTSGRQRVPAEALTHYLLAAPPNTITMLFGKMVQPLFERGSQQARESRILTALRDTLLPKLISGEIRIRDIERIIGRII